MNPYAVLGLETSASQSAIKTAYRRAASQHHTDRGGDKEKMVDVNEAYSTLSDPDKRAYFDRTGSTCFTSIEKEIQANLIQLFNLSIDQEIQGNVIKTLKASVECALDEAKELIRRLEMKNKMLLLKIRKIETDSEENLYHQVIAGKISDNRKKIEQADRSILVMEGAIQRLSNYRDSEPTISRAAWR